MRASRAGRLDRKCGSSRPAWVWKCGCIDHERPNSPKGHRTNGPGGGLGLALTDCDTVLTQRGFAPVACALFDAGRFISLRE
eukprot:5585336-Prymnesium_polylepis.1